MKKATITYFDSLLMRDVTEEFETVDQAKAAKRYRDMVKKPWHHPVKLEVLENGQN